MKSKKAPGLTLSAPAEHISCARDSTISLSTLDTAC
jgi:hypothetical protein